MSVSVVLVAVLCMLLGVAIVTQVRDTKSGDGLDSARPSDLLALLESLNNREASLRQEITTLEQSLETMRAGGSDSDAALAEAQERLDSLRIQVGSARAEGPGITVVVSDPSRGVDADVMLDLLQELRAAGSEAVQFSGSGPQQNVRIGVDSWVTGGPGAVTVDEVALSSPYTVTAIGDPPTMAAALNIPGGVVDTVRRAGGTIAVEQVERVEVSALRE